MLKVENVSKQFPGVPALRYVSLEFNPGRFHALVRKNERIRDLCFSGISVFSISHHLEKIFRLADRIAILRDGSLLITQPGIEFNVRRGGS